MLFGFFLFLVSAPTNTVIRRPIDLFIPRTPTSVFMADQQSTAGANDKLFMMTYSNPSILSVNLANIGNLQVTISKLPDQVVVGPSSLFYMKTNTRSDFVFTDQSRTSIFYGTNTSGTPIINRIACGPFTQISDIHLAEHSGSTTNLIVADKGANAVYSYVLTPNSTTALCTSGVSATVSSPQWLQSLSAANPTIYVGYSDSGGLKLRSYQSSDMTPISSAISITTSIYAKFTKPLFDFVSNELLVPIKLANDAIGADYFMTYDTSDSTLGTAANTVTCRSPDQLQMDFGGGSRYRYVFCPVAKLIQVYDHSNTLITTLPAGALPRKMFVGSDGTTRFIDILQTNASMLLNRIPFAAPSVPTNTSLPLPALMSDVGQLIRPGVQLSSVLVSPTSNLVSFVDLSAQSVASTIYFPQSITALTAESATVADFVSAAANSAYRLTELNANAWTMQFFNVGTFPLQVGFRTNRIYTLNRDSNNLSVINTTSGVVTNLATDTRPTSMDLSAAANSLWLTAETSRSVSKYDITVGSEVAVGSPLGISFTPKKIKYQSSDGTLYVAGGTNAISVNATSMASVSAQTLPATFSDMALSTGGITLSSIQGNALYNMTRTTFGAVALTSPPHLLSSNGAVAVAGLEHENKLTTTSSLTQTSKNPFNRLFSNASNLFAFFPNDSSVYITPYSLFSTTNFPGFSLRLDLTPQITSDDGSGNLWMADSDQLKIQRLSPSLQRQVLYNLPSNFPINQVNWSAQGKIYVALRALNAVAIVNSATSAVAYYSVCQSPR
ncbi:MAG: hypothetical protein JWQ35_2802, partial [Bacteriovoracaceae bacterium]|nr:hypothetical protein [Bacteriovoracaceae bacterium]